MSSRRRRAPGDWPASTAAPAPTARAASDTSASPTLARCAASPCRSPNACSSSTSASSAARVQPPPATIDDSRAGAAAAGTGDRGAFAPPPPPSAAAAAPTPWSPVPAAGDSAPWATNTGSSQTTCSPGGGAGTCVGARARIRMSKSPRGAHAALKERRARGNEGAARTHRCAVGVHRRHAQHLHTHCQYITPLVPRRHSENA